MAEIFRDKSSQAVTIDLNATNVSAKIGRSIASLDVTPVSPVDPPECSAALVPYSITRTDGDFFVEWTYTIDDEVYTRIDQHQIVTPLALRSETGLEQDEYDVLEPLVRHLINIHTQNYFGYYEGIEVVYGEGFDYLVTPARLDNLEKVADGALEYDPQAFVIDNHGRFLRFANGYSMHIKVREALGVDPETGGQPATFDQEVIIAPATGPAGKLRNNGRFEIHGGWGYRSVPTEVKEAAKLLFADYACKDAKYRNKYLQNMRASDFRIQFNNRAFEGTGNLAADKLLSQYVVQGWGLV